MAIISNIHEKFLDRKAKKKPLLTKTKGKASRKIYSYDSNQTASTKENFSPEALAQHRYEGIQLMTIKGLALWKKAMKTSGQAKVVVKTKGARLQGGQAEKEGFHAAHKDPTSGLTDNRFVQLTEEILEEGITPKKRKLLEIKGLEEPVLQEIQNQHEDERFIKGILRKYFAEDSLLKGTSLDRRASATDEVPALVNRCDSRMEKQLRPKIDQLYEACLKGEIGPQEFSDLLIQLFKAFDDRAKEQIEKRIQAFQEYTTLTDKCLDIVEKCIKLEKLSGEDAKSFAEALKGMIELQKQSLEVPLSSAPKAKLRNHYKYFLLMKKLLAKEHKTPIQYLTAEIQRIWSKDGVRELLKEEREFRTKILEDYRKYLSQLAVGSQQIAIKDLIGKYDEEKKRVMTPSKEEMEKVSYNLLKPIQHTSPSIPKKTKRKLTMSDQ